MDPVGMLAETIGGLDEGFLLVVTGAGISAASGLPTFRGDDPGAIWSQSVTEIATVEFFRRDPVTWWNWYFAHFSAVRDALPNQAHRALARIEEWHTDRGGEFLLVTQNVDTLHEAAGSRRLVKAHGTSDRVRCSRDGCVFGSPGGSIALEEIDLEALRQNPAEETLPRCPECGSLIRAHALMFDEFYRGHLDYGFNLIEDALLHMNAVLFIGTSFSVGLTDLVVGHARVRRLPSFSIDPGANPPLGITGIRAPADKTLEEVCRLLGC